MTMPKTVQRIAVMTSGGDAPGMNAAIRAVVRTALHRSLSVTGVLQGFVGLVHGHFRELASSDMANILKEGGTILRTARLPEFQQSEVRAKAALVLKENGIDGLICIGGDGSFQGAHLLSAESQIPVIGIPATIDNDIFGTDLTIGFDTAVNTVLDAVDRIRDTAAAHDRLFIVEVMGRESGFLALEAGLAGGAEEIFFIDNPVTVDQAIDHIRRGMARGKKSSILITAEGHKPGRAYDLAESIRKKANLEARICVLGHLQRGGAPSAADRVLASRLGYAAVEALLQGKSDVMVGVQGTTLQLVPLASVQPNKKKVSRELIQLAQILSS